MGQEWVELVRSSIPERGTSTNTPPDRRTAALGSVSRTASGNSNIRTAELGIVSKKTSVNNNGTTEELGNDSQAASGNKRTT